MKKLILAVLIIICIIVAFAQIKSTPKELPKCDAKETKSLIFNILAENLSQVSLTTTSDIKNIYSLEFLSTKELSYNDTQGSERRTCYAEVSLLNRVNNEKETEEINYTIIFGKNRSEFYVQVN